MRISSIISSLTCELSKYKKYDTNKIPDNKKIITPVLSLKKSDQKKDLGKKTDKNKGKYVSERKKKECENKFHWMNLP
jgi:hypothetical protein